MLFETLKQSCHREWDVFVKHPFVEQLAQGSLPESAFRHFLMQDYIFLLHYSRAHALAVVKSEKVDDLRESAFMVDLLLNHEIGLHVDFCARWGISEQDLQATEEDPANRLYTRYVLDKGHQGDLLDLLVALAPCALGYAEIGKRLLMDDKTRLEGNPYREWIELYGGDEFQEGAQKAAGQLDRVARRRGLSQEDIAHSARWPSLSDNFRTAVKLETGFWEMGLNPPHS
ncbi:thiaminase II [Fodinicurvata fenggangensis]|uniref:thiaminase II n=1 Tax=Fodinicurvata fenggangensis TaxID=1121830 RepID=UPI000478C3D0|nr:thiaminase II [Fodinicurvata fenggangensis]